jgi:hypothetical protein
LFGYALAHIFGEHKPGRGQGSDADGCVETLAGEIDHPISQAKIDGELQMAGQELRQ